ncbi:MAG: ABC transporter permease [Porphyromonadaceae bacterium]|nr:MAG: ABC transporter permease [Porphyromonadaceae bacterium]
MNKINLVIQREYTTRVKKKSFIIMTLLTPVLLAAMLIIPGYLATKEDNQAKVIAVIDKTNITEGAIPQTDYMKFEYVSGTEVETIKQNFAKSGYYAILYIPENVLVSSKVQLYSNQQTTVGVNEHIVKALDGFFTNIKLKNENVPMDIMQRIATNINVDTIQWTSTGEEKAGSAGLVLVIGYISGFLMYFLIFMFGAQVMRGVMEEKSNRIVEVIISSVKPFQLMMGKVVGIALVGLTQFVIWIALTFGIFYGAQSVLKDKPDGNQTTSISSNIMEKGNTQIAKASSTGKYEEMFKEISGKFSAVNFPLILGCFLFFFIGGYLLYASLFAAVGSAVDNDTDTQQFMLPITIPIIVGLFVMMNAMQAPNSSIAVIFSLIPLTSPIVMMARVPYGVPYWQLGLSAFLLIISFMGTIWMAGKIYRIGILMYGKKVNYAELWKWLKYKN